MRNPIRPKNLSLRFLPLYLVGLAILVFHPPERTHFLPALPLITVGTLLRGWGAGHLVKNAALTTTGPYAHLRHPLYAGTILIASGFGVLIGGWPSLAILALLWPWFAFHYFPRKERSEGERLERLYGCRFRRYRDAVPALWPRWRAWRDDEDGVADASGRGFRLARYSENNELGTLLAIGAGLLVFWVRAGVVP